LNQEPAGARVAGLGDGAAALGLARAVLAGHLWPVIFIATERETFARSNFRTAVRRRS
jgi:hypothetical protein